MSHAPSSTRRTRSERKREGSRKWREAFVKDYSAWTRLISAAPPTKKNKNKKSERRARLVLPPSANKPPASPLFPLSPLFFFSLLSPVLSFVYLISSYFRAPRLRIPSPPPKNGQGRLPLPNLPVPVATVNQRPSVLFTPPPWPASSPPPPPRTRLSRRSRSSSSPSRRRCTTSGPQPRCITTGRTCRRARSCRPRPRRRPSTRLLPRLANRSPDQASPSDVSSTSVSSPGSQREAGGGVPARVRQAMG